MYAYNLIAKRFDTPLHSHGYSLLPDGRILDEYPRSAPCARARPNA